MFAPLPFACMSILNGIFAPRLRGNVLCQDSLPPKQRVSLLIPARNEAENLKILLPILKERFSNPKHETDPMFEIIFLNDHSKDNTQFLIRSFEFTVIEGKPLPEGWTGKSWACHQLAEVASGDIFIFMDCDVRASWKAWVGTRKLFETDPSLQALTLLPRQETHGLLARMVIPWVMQVSIFALLPLKLLPSIFRESLALANGQWLAIRRSAYNKIGGHSAVKNSAIEDMAIARLLKHARLKTSVRIASHDLSVEMYSGSRALIEGFSKNLYFLVGQSPLAAVSVGVGMLVIGCAPLFLLAFRQVNAAIVAWLFILIWRMSVSISFRSGFLDLIFQVFIGHGLGAICTFLILMRSMKLSRAGKNIWKGRSLARIV